MNWSQPATPMPASCAIRSSSGRKDPAAPNERGQTKASLRHVGRGADRGLAQELLLRVGPADALHGDLDVGIGFLELVERRAHLRRLGVVEAEGDRRVRAWAARP